MTFFNYIFYRIAQLRFKRDGTKAGTAVTLVSLLQTILLEFIIQPTFMFLFTKSELAIHSKQLGWLAGLIFIVLLILNYRKYSGKYEEYQAYWQNESSGARFYKGMLVLLCFILPVVIIIITNNIMHRK